MDKGPSSWALQNAMTVLLEARDRLLTIDASIDDDAKLLADMLEGEEGDALAVVERVIDASVEADAMAAAAKLRKTDLSERQARFEKRRDALRQIAHDALTALNLKRLERPAWTASLRQMPEPLIVDEEAIGEEWWRVKREVMRAEIRKALASGDKVEGAQLGNASTGISIRTR